MKNFIILIGVIFILGGCRAMVDDIGSIKEPNPMYYEICVDGGNYYLNYNGEKVLLYFSDDLSLIYLGNKYGEYEPNMKKYIDKTGKVVLEPNYYNCDFFSEGYAAIMPDGDISTWGYMDKTGQIIISAIYDLAFMFKDCIAQVHVGGDEGQWMLINTQGECIRVLDEPIWDLENHMYGPVPGDEGLWSITPRHLT